MERYELGSSNNIRFSNEKYLTLWQRGFSPLRLAREGQQNETCCSQGLRGFEP